MIFGLLTALGIILLLAGIGGAVAKYGFQRNEVKLRWIGMASTIGLVLTMSSSVVYYQPAGFNALIQYPSGTQVCHTEPGPHFKWMGNVIEMKKFMTVAETKEVRFNDAVTAVTKVVVRFKMSDVPEKCRQTIIAFRSEANLRHAALKPVVKAVLRNSARLISAQDYVAGKGGVYESAIKDQLNEGLYILETREKKHTKVKIKQDKDRGIDRGKVVRYEVFAKLDKAGLPLRQQHALTQYGIGVSQSEVESVEPSAKFKQKLEKQMAESAKASIAREAAKAAEYEKQKIVANGEKEKAQTQIVEEKKQITLITQAETRRKEEEENLKTERIKLQKARLTAQSKKVIADAEAYAKKAVMLADGALEKRLASYNEAVRDMAAALKDKQLVPKIYFAGGGSRGGQTSSAVDLINLVTAKYAQDLGVKDIPKNLK